MRRHDARRARFIEEYAIDGNAADAAVRAGYSRRSAKEIGYHLLRDPDIAAAVAVHEERALAELEMSAARVLCRLARIAFADLRRLFNPDGTLKALADFDDDTAAALVLIETEEGDRARVRKVRLADKLDALTLLGRHLGLWRDRLEIHTEDLA